jgi:hypothetical protein
VQRGHPSLALGLGRALDGLGSLDRGRVEPVEQPLRLGPGLRGGVLRDHVQPDAESRLAPGRFGLLAHPVQLLRHRGGRLAPGQVGVGVPRRDVDRVAGRAAQVDVRPDRGGDDPRAADVVVVAAEVDPPPAMEFPIKSID